MITLADFLEPIKAADKTLDEDCKGHRMDGMCPEPNMRATVGLGDCNCCDYFASKDNIVVLIEETQLMKMIINLEKEYHYLNIDVQEDFIYTGRVHPQLTRPLPLCSTQIPYDRYATLWVPMGLRRLWRVPRSTAYAQLDSRDLAREEP